MCVSHSSQAASEARTVNDRCAIASELTAQTTWPGEAVNVAADPVNAAVIAELRVQLKAQYSYDRAWLAELAVDETVILLHPLHL